VKRQCSTNNGKNGVRSFVRSLLLLLGWCMKSLAEKEDECSEWSEKIERESGRKCYALVPRKEAMQKCMIIDHHTIKNGGSLNLIYL
jgi:hypothetical protein